MSGPNEEADPAPRRRARLIVGLGVLVVAAVVLVVWLVLFQTAS